MNGRIQEYFVLKNWVQEIEIALLNWIEKLKLFHFKIEDGKMGQDNSQKNYRQKS